MVTEKFYESESCTDNEEELKTKTSSGPRPPAMTVKKEPKEERKNSKKGTAALGKANRQVSITGFFQRGTKLPPLAGQRLRVVEEDQEV